MVTSSRSSVKSGSNRPPILVEIGRAFWLKPDTLAGGQEGGWGWVVAPEAMGHEASCQLSIP